MKKRSKSSQPKARKAIGLLKKTAVGSLIGATVLGTLPSTVGVGHAAPTPSEKPLVTQAGWQLGLKPINFYNTNVNQPRGLFAVSAPMDTTLQNSAPLLSGLAFSDMGQLYLGFGQADYFQVNSFPVTDIQSQPITTRDVVLDSKTEGLFITSGQGNVYRLYEGGNTMQAEALIDSGVIADPTGIDFETDAQGVNDIDTLYVAGGTDHTIWKLTHKVEFAPDNIGGADPDATDPVDTDTNTNTDTDTVTTQDISTSYTAEPIKVFDNPVSDLSDLVYEDGYLYVTDAGLGQVVKINAQSPSDTPVVLASGLNDPQSLDVDANDNVYIADTKNNQVMKYDAASGTVGVVAGTGKVTQQHKGLPAIQTSLHEPTAVAVDSFTGTVYIADTGQIQKLVDQFFYKQEKDANGTVWNLVENVEGLDHLRDSIEYNYDEAAPYYRLTKDISKSELDAYLAEHKMNGWQPIGEGELAFRGVFDGGGHVIDGLTVDGNANDYRYSGLFGTLYQATIQNLRLTNVDIDSYRYAGALVAQSYSSHISKVAAEGSVSGSRTVGGLIGESTSTDMDQTYFAGTVEGSGDVGGLIGHAEVENGSRISNSYAWADITLNTEPVLRTSDSGNAGGFVGSIYYYDNSDFGPSEPQLAFQNNYSSSTVSTTHEPFGIQSDVTTMNIIESHVGPFEGYISSENDVPHVSNYWDVSTFGESGTSQLASKLTAAQMKTLSSFKDWDFTTIWTMDRTRQNYPILQAFPIPTPTTPTNPSTGGGTSTPVVNTPAPTNTTTINVNVQNNTATNGAVVASLAITRTKGADGTVKDQLQLTPAKAKEILDLLKTSGSKTAAIVLPDAGDEVSEWNVNVPKDASAALTAEGVQLVILNPNVRISVPASSLTGLTDDLYFRLIPVKSTATSAEIQQRALGNAEIVKTANGGDITVVGRPMTIETNLQSRPVTLTLPLPANSNFTAAQQQKLGVYIEHSDGTKQLVRGKVVTLEDGKQGLEITVNHFSTFTIVNVSKWGGTLNAAPYIMGYADGSFKPAQDITRAELAAIVSRITGVTEGSASFSDVKNGSWASTVVGPAAASGIMTGYSDGTFKPNASITRGELAAALAKLLPQSGLSASASGAGFGDLNGHWAASAASELQAAGVVTGYADGSFKPEQAVTRAEAVTMINRLIGLDASMTVPGASEWSDVSASYWAHDAVRAASMAR